MRKPLSITFIVKKNRTGWSIAVRFNSSDKQTEGGVQPRLPLRQYNAFTLIKQVLPIKD